jgi:hypothetical protein
MSGESAVYEQLTALLERELELAARGDWSGLGELHTARERLVATLPAVPPPGARTLLERCWALHRRITVELLRGREALLGELCDLQRAQRAARGYAPPPVERADLCRISA